MEKIIDNNSGTQTIRYFAPNTGMWGSFLGETDITSYPPLGSFWEETGMGEFTIPSGSTSAIVDAIVANKDTAHLFQAGMWKKHEGFSPGPSGEPLPDIDVNYHKYSTVMKVKKSLGNRKLGEKVMVLLSFNGIAYERFEDDPPFDLNLVKYKGQKPVEVDPATATATYLVEVAVGEGFVIADTDFEWPKSKRSTVVGDPEVDGVTSTNILKSRFSFEWFHNEEVIVPESINMYHSGISSWNYDEVPKVVVEMTVSDTCYSDKPAVTHYVGNLHPENTKVKVEVVTDPPMKSSELPSDWEFKLEGGSGLILVPDANEPKLKGTIDFAGVTGLIRDKVIVGGKVKLSMPIVKFHVLTSIQEHTATMEGNIHLADIYVFQQTQFNTPCHVNVNVIPQDIKPDGILKWKRVRNTTMLAFNPDIGLTGDNIYNAVVTGSSYNRVSADINDYAVFENSFTAKNGAKAFHWGAVRVRTCEEIYINHPGETVFTAEPDSPDTSNRHWAVRIWIKDNLGDFLPSNRLNGMLLSETVTGQWPCTMGNYTFNGTQNWAIDNHSGNFKGYEGCQADQTISLDHISRTHTIHLKDIDTVDGLEFLNIQNNK